MAMKVKITLACVVSPSDTKTSVKRITRIHCFDDDVTYVFPDVLQIPAIHAELCKLPIIAKGLSQLKLRGKIRELNVTLPEEIAQLYFDEEGNAYFKETFLDVAIVAPSVASPFGILVKLTPRSWAKEIVLEKFVGKNQNPESWLEQFESECVRLGIPQIRYTETFRLFLESNAALDWFAIQLKILGLDSQWSIWRAQFVEDFSPKGWSGIIYAYNYQYIRGTLVDFALKKFRVLIDADSELTESSRINLVVLGLPENVRNKLDKRDIISQSDLISELQALEHMVSQPSKSHNNRNYNQSNLVKSKTSCSFCKKNNKIHWNYKDSDCYLNPENKKEIKGFEKKPIKVANNVILEGMLNESVPDVKN